MLDDLERLQNNPRLVELLRHYADLGKDDRAIWQDRLMHMEGIESKELSRLHGELIAFEWIEQNTGQTSGSKVCAACYRITLNGLRATGRCEGTEFDNKPAEIPEKASRKFSRKKKREAAATEGLKVVAVE